MNNEKLPPTWKSVDEKQVIVCLVLCYGALLKSFTYYAQIMLKLYVSVAIFC